jgi:glycosyltransferase involved in cell wall biosynthesis
VSRFVPEKRHLDLINAFNEANLQGWKLVLVGDSDHPDEYSRNIITISKKLPNVVITGFQSGLPLAELYANAGVFVLPSSHEGLPIAMLEALSYNLPVLASDIPANLEVGLPDKLYFPLGDIPALAEALCRMADEATDPRQHLVPQSWVKERYNWPRIASRTLEVYKQTASNLPVIS